MVPRNVASARVARATSCLADAARLFDQPPDNFASALPDRDLAFFYLFLGIQECIDLAAHWVADAGRAPPDDAGSTFDVLAERGVIDPALAATLHADARK